MGTSFVVYYVLNGLLMSIVGYISSRRKAYWRPM